MDMRNYHALQRLRAVPIDVITKLSGLERAPSSLGEAQAAAYLDGRLRLANWNVSADSFHYQQGLGFNSMVVGIPALVCVVLYFYLPYPSLFLALWCLLVSLVLLRDPDWQIFSKRRQSQNIVATQAAKSRPRRRLILLAPIDAPLVMPDVIRWLCSDMRAHIGRVVASTLLVVLLIAAWFGPYELRVGLWVAQSLPMFYLLFLSGLEYWQYRMPVSPGATCYAASLAALISTAEELSELERTEVWVAGIGASSNGAGLRNLLARYPFDKDMTYFVVLGGIGAGNLCYITRQGFGKSIVSSPQLRELAAEADAADPLINAEPHIYRRSLTLSARLRNAGYHSLSIACLDAQGNMPYRAMMGDKAQHVDLNLVERTTRFLVGLVRQADQRKA